MSLLSSGGNSDVEVLMDESRRECPMSSFEMSSTCQSSSLNRSPTDNTVEFRDWKGDIVEFDDDFVRMTREESWSSCSHETVAKALERWLVDADSV